MKKESFVKLIKKEKLTVFIILLSASIIVVLNSLLLFVYVFPEPSSGVDSPYMFTFQAPSDDPTYLLLGTIIWLLSGGLGVYIGSLIIGGITDTIGGKAPTINISFKSVDKWITTNSKGITMWLLLVLFVTNPATPKILESYDFSFPPSFALGLMGTALGAWILATLWDALWGIQLIGKDDGGFVMFSSFPVFIIAAWAVFGVAAAGVFALVVSSAWYYKEYSRLVAKIA